MSATHATDAEVLRLRQHITWLHGTLQRLGDLQVLASTIDPPMELSARIHYARGALANSLRRCVEAGVADRPPTLSALIVGHALARTPQEQAANDRFLAAPGRQPLAVAWCNEDGLIGVDFDAPGDNLALAEGLPHVLWHWIEELAVRGAGTRAGAWFVPGITACASIQARADAARLFAWNLDQAARGARSLLARPEGERA
jgi:hypothetical protein